MSDVEECCGGVAPDGARWVAQHVLCVKAGVALFNVVLNVPPPILVVCNKGGVNWLRFLNFEKTSDVG